MLKMKTKGKQLAAAILIAAMLLALAGCGNSEVQKTDEKTLIYGSGDYTAINPALYEHGEINLLLFWD